MTASQGALALEISPIEVLFHGAVLLVVEHNGQPYVPMKPVVDGMEMDWAAQFTKLKANSGRWGIVKITIPSNGGNQEAVCLPLRKLPGWLMTISPNKVRPELREKVITYQNEADDILWDAWQQKAATPSTPRIDVRALLLDGQSDLTLDLPDNVQAALNARAGVLAGEAFTLIREHLRRRIAYHAVSGRPSSVNEPKALRVIAEGDLGEALAHGLILKVRHLLSHAEYCVDLSTQYFTGLQGALHDLGCARSH
ncbi:phage antirepressor N-terminal domain-containing protein [Bordetella avium]|uniref:Phage anti-repressor protein n=2 Tax=Bordetella avium TaxID=521 RepID=Q2KZ11_BORA1|nr:phage antirepressor N-terminal domain-containing protein [Bordetella avium]CAJ48040.1 Putative phage anti-repressor protein [Bordetella avium 197N]